VIQSLRHLADELERRASQLEHSLEQRIAIEQAKGVLAERLGLPVAACEPILESAARTRGVAVHGLATLVLSGAVDLDLRPAS
jgi:AmiR/NasT family two-component response regulator